MSDITFSRPGEWDTIFPSPAGTIRSPATALVSIDRREAALNELGRTATEYIPCACGGLRRRSANPHGHRWLSRKRVDCMGNEVTP